MQRFRLVAIDNGIYFEGSIGKGKWTGIKLEGEGDIFAVHEMDAKIQRVRYCDYWLEFYGTENGYKPDDLPELDYRQMSHALHSLKGGFYDFDKLMAELILDTVLKDMQAVKEAKIDLHNKPAQNETNIP